MVCFLPTPHTGHGRHVIAPPKDPVDSPYVDILLREPKPVGPVYFLGRGLRVVAPPPYENRQGVPTLGLPISDPGRGLHEETSPYRRWLPKVPRSV